MFYWYYEAKLENQFVQGIPLNGKGFFYFATFNWLCLMAVVSHLRAAFADPGRIPAGMKAPFQSEFIPIKSCEKCEGPETWKPMRAHHCRECGFCIFKVSPGF
jgi:ribosomal protein L40E